MENGKRISATISVRGRKIAVTDIYIDDLLRGKLDLGRHGRVVVRSDHSPELSYSLHNTGCVTLYVPGSDRSLDNRGPLTLDLPDDAPDPAEVVASLLHIFDEINSDKKNMAAETLDVPYADELLEHLEERIEVLEGGAAWNKTQYYGLDARIKDVERRLEFDGLIKKPTSKQFTSALGNERPCLVNRSGAKCGAVFHAWAQAGCADGSYPAAIIEYRSGEVEYVEADQVKFLDTNSRFYPSEMSDQRS
jgi:hypothetical protein